PIGAHRRRAPPRLLPARRAHPPRHQPQPAPCRAANRCRPSVTRPTVRGSGFRRSAAEARERSSRPMPEPARGEPLSTLEKDSGLLCDLFLPRPPGPEASTAEVEAWAVEAENLVDAHRAELAGIVIGSCPEPAGRLSCRILPQ